MFIFLVIICAKLLSCNNNPLLSFDKQFNVCFHFQEFYFWRLFQFDKMPCMLCAQIYLSDRVVLCY